MVATANLWVKFFQAAGVPNATAASYAHIFYENRMDLDMLLDLNKEYLREMGITPMGDIISILRHAKKVYEQNMREKILSGEKQSIATVSVSPLMSSVAVSQTQIGSNSSTDFDAHKPDKVQPSTKPARRVLPEHEGRYKITLPSGITKRSKEILAKKEAMLYSDKEEKKKGIFDRLEIGKGSTSSVNEKKVKVTGLDRPGASIFSRLGGKSDSDDLDINEKAFVAFAGAIKSAPNKIVGIKKLTKPQQKVILVKKIPAKAATMIADEYEADRMETGEKSVSFSTTDEILEIESRRQLIAKTNKSRINKANSVRARLGLNVTTQPPTVQSAALLHRTKKIIKLKPPVLKRANGSPLNVSSLKSDEVKTSIKHRLTLKKTMGGPEVNKLVNRIGRDSLSSRLGMAKSLNSSIQTNSKKLKASPSSSSLSSSSVFDRLGFNKK